MIPGRSKQKTDRKSGESDMLSDIENHDIMLEGNDLEREESEYSNFGSRPDSPCYDTSESEY